MSKKSRNKAQKQAPPAVSLRAPKILLGLAVAETLLAIFQWIELAVLYGGGSTLCGINETFNCETVWTSRPAQLVHEAIGVPVAALGIMWGLTAALLPALVLRRKGEATATQRLALRLTAIAGLVACVALAAGSLASGAFCPTCLLTYALVLGFGYVALRHVPARFVADELPAGLLWAAAPAFFVYLALLGPGLATPHTRTTMRLGDRAGASIASGEEQAVLESYLDGLTQIEKQALADSLAVYKHSMSGPLEPPRARYGPADAPVHIVEFTDILCSHCRDFVKEMQQLKKAVPPSSISVDARYFPLDSACNRGVMIADKSGMRCLGAKAQICLESAPDYWELQAKLFEAQPGLTPGQILDIASSGSVSREALQRCIDSSQTAEKLRADVEYALRYQPEGTPLVLLNGRDVPPVPTLLYAMALTRGNPDAPAFAKLPPPREKF